MNGSNSGISSNDAIAKNKQAMQRFYDEVINKHDLSKIDSFVAPTAIEHQTMSGKEETITPDSVKKGMQDWFTMYPDVHLTVNFMLADSNTVMAEWTQTGTNTGPMMGMPPTNKPVTVHGVDIVKLDKQGRATEHWGYYEERSEMKQLGMMPEMKTDSAMMKKDMKKKK
jgi:steroid delta-isomerase-like uncharacterized protein